MSEPIKCCKCKQSKTRIDFYPRKNGKNGLRGECKECVKNSNVKAYQKISSNQDLKKAKNNQHKEYTRKARMKVLLHYSNGTPKCSCCGENNLEFLVIDHINDNGAEERKRIGSTSAIVFSIIKREYPPGYRILCQNCNMGFYLYGVCPHMENLPLDDLFQPR